MFEEEGTYNGPIAFRSLDMKFSVLTVSEKFCMACIHPYCPSIWATALSDLTLETLSFPLKSESLSGDIPSHIHIPYPTFFVKICSSAPRDAAFINGDSLECHSLADAWTLLTNSGKILGHTKNEHCHLIARPFLSSLDRSGEFRVFLKDGEILGLSQRHFRHFFPQLNSKKFQRKILHHLLHFVNSAIDRFAYLETGEIAVDVYISPDFRTKYVLDIADVCDPLLFENLGLLQEERVKFLYVKNDKERDTTEVLTQVPLDLATMFFADSCILFCLN